LEIDLTSSLIDKDLQEILFSLQPEPPTSTSNASSRTWQPIHLDLIARRNQWSSKDASAFLNYILTKSTPTLPPLPPSPQLSEAEDDTLITTNPEEENCEDKTTQTTNEDSTISLAAAAAAVDDNDDDTIKLTSSANQDDQQKRGSAALSFSPSIFLPFVRSLDLSWNNFSGHDHDHEEDDEEYEDDSEFHVLLQQLISHVDKCPSVLRFNACGLGPPACRAIAKGIVNRFQRPQNIAEKEKAANEPTSNEAKNGPDSADATPMPVTLPLSLYLVRNEDIDDVGVAALAAAIRTVASPPRRRIKRKELKSPEKNQSNEDKVKNTCDDASSLVLPPCPTILERLDMSGCSIGDAGAEALANALEGNPLCVKHLDLSNNHISDSGAVALARALLASSGSGRSQRRGKVETLDLSHNKDLGDRGAKELAHAFREGCIEHIILRSCHLHAEGAASFAEALQAIARKVQGQSGSEATTPKNLSIDLSGNPLGILRKKSKAGAKYSATALKSKATATTAAYMNLIGKTVQKGLKDLGLADSGGFPESTLESDDEEESKMGKTGEDDDSKTKCGALSFAEAFIEEDEGMVESSTTYKAANEGNQHAMSVELGLRHCSFDTRAAEALAAVLQESRQKYPAMKLTVDLTMNHVLEDDTIAALCGLDGYNDQIADMADSYLDAMEIIREAQERGLAAARIATVRANAQAELDAAWGAPVPSRGRTDDRWNSDEEWDSDADYDMLGEDDDW
jgi:hypothetical protein